MITYQRREFVNELNDIVCAKLQIDHRIASADHPQTNGLQEKFNQTLERALIKYRNSVHASTGVTPFTTMFRRDPVLPIYPDTGSYEAVETRVTTEEAVKELTESIVRKKRQLKKKSL